MSHQWVYREDVPNGEMVLLAEVEARFKDGWVDTPAKFGQEKEVIEEELEEAISPKLADVIIRNITDVSVSELGDMSKDDLEVYAKEMFGVDIDRRKSHKNLVKQIEELEAN